MVQAHGLYLGLRHGNACTCHPLEPVTILPVVVDDACPSLDAELHPLRWPTWTTHRLAITWPSPSPQGAPLAASEVQVHDYDTGEEILTATAVRVGASINAGDMGGVFAELTMLVDERGAPIRNGEWSVLHEHGHGARTGVFRYFVAEMRIAEVTT
jgi:hypothetical protein